jgi:monoterpene epsilon-lactone hydrolase
MTLKIAIAASALIATAASAQQQPTVDRFSVASTVSPEATARLKLFGTFLRAAPKNVKPQSIADWDRKRAESVAFADQLNKPVLDKLKPTITEEKLGGVPIVRLRPAGWRPTGRTLVFIHGGGYVTGSARASVGEMAAMAAATGDEVLGIEYTLAPRGRWQAVTDEVLAVWRALLKSGVAAQSVGLYGGSAGGGLAAGAVLKMRDAGLPLPGALYLQSPWADITPTGDTITTLAAAEPLLTSETLAWGADLYADPKDQKNPYVSPVYGDYTRPFPPTLIQIGTREIFLSHAVRQYQAIRGGGHEAVLDAYEGMPHGFPALFADTPEGRTAYGRAAEFFKAHLRAGRAK